MTEPKAQKAQPVKAESLPVTDGTKLYTTLKAIDEAIASASSQANDVQIEFQKIACSVIVHLGKNFDIRVFNRMLDAMPEGMRKDSMAAFFDKYSVVAFDEEGQAGINKTKGTKLGEALTNPWWKAKKAMPYVPYSFIEKLKEFKAQAEKRAKKADKQKEAGIKDNVDQVTWEQVNALTGLIRSLETKITTSVDPLAEIAA